MTCVLRYLQYAAFCRPLVFQHEQVRRLGLLKDIFASADRHTETS